MSDSEIELSIALSCLHVAADLPSIRANDLGVMGVASISVFAEDFVARWLRTQNCCRSVFIEHRKTSVQDVGCGQVNGPLLCTSVIGSLKPAVIRDRIGSTRRLGAMLHAQPVQLHLIPSTLLDERLLNRKVGRHPRPPARLGRPCWRGARGVWSWLLAADELPANTSAAGGGEWCGSGGVYVASVCRTRWPSCPGRLLPRTGCPSSLSRTRAPEGLPSRWMRCRQP
eukprot:scaffold294494_cov41-Tisochrysis_lutea.AAC.2